jgi:predicted sulfurtransferase/predicted O-methyltransferase YrrM
MNLVRKTKRQFIEEWGKLGVLGRVYVALEGINAQISVPTVNLEAFKTLVQNTEVLNGVRVYEGDEVDSHGEGFPFEELAVRIKKLIVADHFPEQPEDLSQTGTPLEPEQWDKELESNKDVLVVDCRNYYESEIGLFEGAKRLKIDRHKESIAAIEELLEMNQINAESNKKLMIYCTGGIRCEKIGAHLVQHKGLKNVLRLEGGINNYFKQLQEKQNHGVQISSKFIGKNFVFDNRMRTGNKGLTVTPHVVIGKCHTCGAPCDEHSNCINPICNLILLQCPQCSSKLQGACSPECAETAKLPAEKLQEMKVKASKEGRMFSRSFEIVQERKNTQKKSSAEIPSEIVYPKIEQYCDQHTTVPSPALEFIAQKTVERYSFAAHMMVGPVVGQFLKTLARTTNATNVLEIGTFTGYSAVCLAEGIKDGGKIITCDMDKEAVDIAREAFKLSTSGGKIETRVNTAMKSLEEITQRKEGPFELIFIDADRKNNKAYYNFILKHNLLAPNGLMLIDNMLWRGNVVKDTADEHAQVVKEFTDYVHQDPRTENVLLSIRDGMLMITLKQ